MGVKARLSGLPAARLPPPLGLRMVQVTVISLLFLQRMISCKYKSVAVAIAVAIKLDWNSWSYVNFVVANYAKRAIYPTFSRHLLRRAVTTYEIIIMYIVFSCIYEFHYLSLIKDRCPSELNLKLNVL